MKKKIIASALVLVILGTASASLSYADYRPFPSYIYSIDANKEPIEIISPKEEIVVQDSLLISVQIQEGISVSLSVYKEAKEEALIFGPEKVDTGESLNFYSTQLKDLSPGKYRIVFDIAKQDGKEQKPMIKYFTVKDKKEALKKTLENIEVINISDDILQTNDY
ncbi:hypothetical protein [Marinisporobacter balticus]|uniref:Uncharacterized protein n=1 Tax=Marinisporobacter balticus TaxID=2018667 RepID=A0A4R2L2F5_9FIRM|nr:hypothetical protein [Marinisporobacter balticus]TCO77936.1 hypothetical protein EV214_10532 [Marinisporobacter balticus]